MAAQKSESALKTIREAAAVVDVPQHVLRFWETKFRQLQPLKMRGGRRYYRPEDIALLQRIHALLYTQGYTIKGARKALAEKKVAAPSLESPLNIPPSANENHIAPAAKAADDSVEKMQAELLQFRAQVRVLRDALAAAASA